MTVEDLVGRDHPLQVLADAFATADGGRLELVLVTGEPGIGKSALVTTAAAGARHAGALVLAGSCWDGHTAPGYWPWVQVVRAYAAEMGPARWEQAAGDVGIGLRLLLGETPGPAPDHSDGGGGAPDEGAFEIFDAVTRLLAAAGRARPVVVILEDLHWADAASLRLLGFLARHAPLARVLVIGTYRDVGLDATGHRLRPLFDELASGARTLSLAGLDRDAVAALVHRTAGSAVDAALVAELHRRSGGNPFFVEQTAQLWALGGEPSVIAPRVRDAIERRLARLPSATNELLARAAILGTDLDPDVLEAVIDQPGVDVPARLDEAVAARLLTRRGGSGVAFVHDLVRETLISGLGPTEAERHHAAVVAAADRSPSLRRRLAPASVADHAYRALPEIAPATALRWLLAAAHTAAARAAFEEAATHLARALDVAREGAFDEWSAIALDLGDAQRRAGSLDEARTTLTMVEEAAHERRHAGVFARAVLGHHLLGQGIDDAEMDDPRTVLARLDEAYVLVIDEDAGLPGKTLAARLLAARARSHMHLVGGDRARAEEVSAYAVEVAGIAGDPAALAFCLLARHDALWRPGTAAERAAIAEEMADAARAAGDLELELQASMLRSAALLELGDPRGMEELQRYIARARRAGLARVRYVAATREATVALLQGRHGDARCLIDESRELGERLGEIDAYGVWNDQRWQLAVREGRLDEIESLLDALTERADNHALVLEASLAVERGDTGRAEQLLAPFRALGRRWPQWAALLWYTVLAEMAETIGDPALAHEIEALIEPHTDAWAVLGGGVLVRGPMRLWLGRLAAMTGHFDRAIEHYETAHQSALALGARPVTIELHYRKAIALRGRGGPGDTAAAGQLLAGILADATELGMTPLVTRARAALADPVGGETGAPAPAVNVFRRTDEVWTLTYAGRTARVPDTKGLADLHALLSRPGDDLPATHLLDPAAGPELIAARSLGGDDILDEHARNDYRRRLDELDDQIDRALTRHDDDHARALERERDALIDELRTATGLRHRPRRLGDERERARKTVTARIRDTLKRLDTRHPQLAEHLRASVTTGAACSYRPPSPTDWQL